MENIQNLVFPIIAAIFLLGMLYLIPLALWFAATLSGVRISMLELTFMRLRRSPVKEIVEALIVSAKAGLGIDRNALEAFALGGGNVRNVVLGMAAAKRAGFPLSFENAIKADAQGLDIVESVKEKMRKTEEVRFE